ncbi:uncharacterized protein LOC126379090 [Pectinophora gossypiella]|uniref:uncharacterized protein LOC126379090 n=1 Tax=Pectinophora gossypiella TaxID=13191 RepID=UPI00214EF1A9|nr:uncharacterized protein LOC126379090 [Pectinophora gossypiella]
MPEWKSGFAGEKYPLKEKDDKKKPKSAPSATAAGDASSKKEGKKKDDKEVKDTGKKGKDEKGKTKEEPAKGKGGKDEKKKDEPAPGKGGKKAAEPEPPEEIPLTPSQIAREEAEYRAQVRRRNLCKRQWPEVTKVKVHTKPWAPPGPPERPPKVLIELPPLETRRWKPPFLRRRKPRPKLLRILPEEMTIPPQYEGAKLRKIWHNFIQVDTNKMMLQGSIGCNSKRYSSTHCGSQTGCIALVCRALLDEKTPAELVRRDVDDVIESGDRFYKSCMVALKCYKGKPQLELNQLMPSFFFHDTKYTVKMQQVDKGLLAKHPDNLEAGSDLLQLMEKRAGSNYMMILTVGGDRHFLIWGHPPESAGSVKTICYIFDPHLMNEVGEPFEHKYNTKAMCCVPNWGAGAFLRYPGITSFVLDFWNSYADLHSASKTKPKPPITLTNIEVVQREPLIREPKYDLDLKALKVHCQSEWDSLNINALIDQKRYHGKYPLASLSAISLASSRKSSRRRMRDFFQKTVSEPPPVPPIQPEKPPAAPTNEQIMQLRGEDFFLHCPKADAHTFGRDDLIPLPKEEVILHSPVEIADKNYNSQFTQLDVEKWILRATRHFASYRYQTFKNFTGVACCVSALALLQRMRARAWNEDTLDETLDLGYNLFRESLLERGGPIRRLVLGELKENFRVRDKEYKHKERGIAVWGKLISTNPKVFDLCRGIEAFFKEADSGILQIPGEYETAIWNEGGKYYVYHPWPADRYGTRVSLQGGGKACLLYFTRVTRLCEYFMDNVRNLKRKPFSISEIGVFELGERPEPVNKMTPVAPSRWIVRGNFHEGDERFPEDHRNKQATPTSIAAIAMAELIDPAEWTPADINECLVRGDILYEKTMEHLDKLGINFETPAKSEENEGGEEEEVSSGTTGTLAAADVLPRFQISEYDCIETDIMDSQFSGQLSPEPGSGVMSLKQSLAALFKDNKAGVFTARGGSMAVWKHDNHLYMFDPHGCDENGLPSDDTRAAACLVRMKNNINELADVIMGNLGPGSDDSFNLSPVDIIASKLNAEIGAPETKLENKAFEWLNRGTAQILMGPRGENSAIGKSAHKAKLPEDDLAGRTLALPACAAFTAATDAVPPPGMHQDHMFNFLEAGSEYYKNHVKKTGRKDINVEDLSEKFEMGVNTFSIEVGESTRLPLRLPDKLGEGGGEEEEENERELGEGEEMPKEEPMKQMKDLLFKMWYDTSKPTTVSLLLGDYHQLGLWMAAGGKVVAFDPAPTLHKGLLTPQRIKKGDELRLQRIKDEMTGEGGGEEEEDEEAGGEGEALPEPEPEFVPPESCPVLMVFASPGEFIDKLVEKGGLDNKQMIAPYWLYPVTVTNELTSLLKEKKPGAKGDAEEGEDVAAEEEALVEPLDDAAMGKYFMRMGRTVASVRGRVAQNENYFMDKPNRDNQDAANAVMGIVVDNIEPYVHWKPSLIDGVLKYGDRLYTMSVPSARQRPRLVPSEVQKEFHVTNFNVKLEVEGNVVNGDVKAGDTGGVLNLKRGLKKFFEAGHKHGVICAKDYCVGVWKAADDKAFCYWDPHSIGPTGKISPGGAAGLVLFSTLDELAETFKHNIDELARPGTNKYSISAVKVFWEFAKTPSPVSPQGAVPDEGYEWKVLTAYVETARGRTILRGSRPADLNKFIRDALLQSSASAIVAACMSHVRRPHLWTRKTVDEILGIGCKLFTASLAALGYEFRPGEDVLLPLQVLKRFVLGSNYVRYELEHAFSGRLEQKEPSEMTVRAALERFFERHTHGILWSVPHAVAVWRVIGAPSYYMMEPHACGPTGLRIDAMDDGAACVLTFTSPKLMAYAYLQNIPVVERPKHEFVIYAMSLTVHPIKKMKNDPPLLTVPPGTKAVPATSKVGLDGQKRRAEEKDRKHPPGSTTCLDAQKAADERDREDAKYKGQRNSNGWLVLSDGTQYLSAQHSMACKRYPYASRGNQALACSVMAVAMSRVEDVCRWCSTTLDQVLDSGDQLYQDSYLHYKPADTNVLTVEQILRKFYTPGNCVCRVVVYQSRQKGTVDKDLLEKLQEFFREEKAGVFVSGNFAVALFRSPRGFYMFDPADRDRYGRAVAPPCVGKARACFSQYPTVKALAEKLGANIPPPTPKPTEARKSKSGIEIKSKTSVRRMSQVHFEGVAEFEIYGMGVSSLRRLNQHEK